MPQVRRARQLEVERRARQQEAARCGGGYMYGGGHEAERGGVLPALGGTALRMAASASKSLLLLPSPTPSKPAKSLFRALFREGREH